MVALVALGWLALQVRTVRDRTYLRSALERIADDGAALEQIVSDWPSFEAVV